MRSSQNALSFIRTVFGKYKKQISLILTIIFAVLIVYYIKSNLEDFMKISIVNPWQIIVLFFAMLMRTFSTGLTMDVVLKPLGINLSIMESFGLANLTRLINQLTPGKGGLVMRSIYLKRKYKLSYAKFISSLAITHVYLYIVSSVIGAISLLGLNILGKSVNHVLLLILLGAIATLLVLISIPSRYLPATKYKRLSEIVNGWHKIKQDMPTLMKLTGSSMLFILSTALIMWSSFGALGVEINIWTALVFTSFIIINTVIAITPSGFGFSEGIIVVVGHSFGIATPTALTAALLQTVISFFGVLLVSSFFAKHLFGKSPIKLLRNQYR